MKEKINIQEKIGDFLLSLIQLIVGGIIFSAIMADKSINSIVLYVSSLIVIIVLVTVAIALYRFSNKIKKG